MSENLRLPHHFLFVAGLGRRKTGDRATVGAALKKVLQGIADVVPHAQPVAMASGAAGADQLFLAAAQELGWPIRLVLPVAGYQFEKDFESTRANPDGSYSVTVDEVGRGTFRQLQKSAVEVFVIPPAPSRGEAFTQCANTLVADADVVVVLRDDEPGGVGGTNETLLVINTLPEEVRPTVIELSATDGSPRPGSPKSNDSLAQLFHARHHAGDISSGHHTDRDRRSATVLHDLNSATDWRDLQRQPLRYPLALAEIFRLGKRLASGAEAEAKKHTNLNLGSILWHLLAAFIGLTGLFIGEETVHHFGLTNVNALRALAGCAAVLSLIKLLLVSRAYFLSKKAQDNGHKMQWVKVRFLREINRSLYHSRFVARYCGENHGNFVPPSIWILFRHLRLPFLLLHAHQGTFSEDRQIRLGAATTEEDLKNHPEYPENLLGSISWFRKYRLQEQRDYNEKACSRGCKTLSKIHRSFRAAFWLFVAAAVVAGGCAALQADWLPFLPAESVWKSVHHDGWIYKLAKFLTVFLPVLSASLLVGPNLFDSHRRRRVCRALAKTLARLDREAEAIEQVLRDAQSAMKPTTLPDGTVVWAKWKTGPDTPTEAVQRQAALEAWARARFAAIAREAEYAILTEVIGFKTFVESVEVG